MAHSSFYAVNASGKGVDRLRPSSKMVMQRIANPPTPVRFRPRPPLLKPRRSMVYGVFYCLQFFIPTATFREPSATHLQQWQFEPQDLASFPR